MVKPNEITCLALNSLLNFHGNRMKQLRGPCRVWPRLTLVSSPSTLPVQPSFWLSPGSSSFLSWGLFTYSCLGVSSRNASLPVPHVAASFSPLRSQLECYFLEQPSQTTLSEIAPSTHRSLCHLHIFVLPQSIS